MLRVLAPQCALSHMHAVCRILYCIICGLFFCRYTRKRGITTLIRIMARLGQQRPVLSPIEHNERLEFLGDAVVGYLTSVHLFLMFPDLSEGALTTFRTVLVNNQHLATLAEVRMTSLNVFMQFHWFTQHSLNDTGKFCGIPIKFLSLRLVARLMLHLCFKCVYDCLKKVSFSRMLTGWSRLLVAEVISAATHLATAAWPDEKLFSKQLYVLMVSQPRW